MSVLEKDLIVNLKGRDFLALIDYSTEEIHYLIDFAIKLKKLQKAGEFFQPLKGKTLGMIFEKSSTRTRVSFEVGMYQLGGSALFLSKNDLQIGRGESIWDTGRVMSGYLDGIMIRTYEHRKLIDLARGSTVPVINGLTDLSHPCQVLADLQSIVEQKGKLNGLKMAYIGDGNNMVHSLMMGAAKVGMNLSIATPPGYEPNKEVIKLSQENALVTGANIEIHNDPKQAASDADVVYTDVWASMGFEEEQGERIQAFKDFQVNEDLMKYAKSDYLFMHCLPAHRGEEVTGDIMDGKHSIVFDQAENRLHAQKAIMASIL
ncbi:ornithine carbamoyltransferase [Chengkuizengella axinellae]|uniref:Ornithine carbamoyltransferase n=1 Tax=Chengkuizengella axinellae TaxID=3064388 RepID=A0ABT9J2Q5_9BACL|nr:ornithine carbamoyltransferase [Chengkuizengella sp. 2205SS18-9]MDP5275901.1 ornithine carbamoyltransferase [Chengkuizengella sp. 2205SS18-9]